MAENVKKSGTESYPVTTGIIGEIKKWYWVLLAILSLTATAFYATAKITYKPVYQSYASLTPSLRDAATADTIEKLAGELMDKAKDGRLAEALGVQLRRAVRPVGAEPLVHAQQRRHRQELVDVRHRLARELDAREHARQQPVVVIAEPRL